MACYPQLLWQFHAPGIFWVGLHAQYNYIKFVDRPMLWINLLFLMFIALLPFQRLLWGAMAPNSLPSFVRHAFDDFRAHQLLELDLPPPLTTGWSITVSAINW